MFEHITRSVLIQVWFGLVAVAIAASVAFGVSLSIGTAVMLLALCLVPPALVVSLWPGAQPRTVAQVLHDADQSR